MMRAFQPAGVDLARLLPAAALPSRATTFYLVGFIALVVLAVIAVLLGNVFHRRLRERAAEVWQEEAKPAAARRQVVLPPLFSSPVVTLTLLVAIGFSLVVLIPRLGAFRLPGIQRGYEPPQPIAFSHRLHAGELQVACLYCHSGAEKSRHAGVPSANVCMNCHKFVTAPLGAVRAEDEQAKKENRQPRLLVSPELAKLYGALALDPSRKMQPDPGKQPRPIVWNKVDNLPDFVYFDHRPHVAAGVGCQKCHGPVETMERVRQVEDLTMGWCVNCHRTVNQAGVATPAGVRRVNASIDCATCHY